ncbi:hypothetical protein CR513_16931, partial [Mucuna pruriens]
MKALFSFSLDRAAKHWLYLQPILFNTWKDMKRMFLEKFFPINEQLLIQYFYKDLTMMDRIIIDVASGRALIDKTPVAARHLISNMTSNTQQFRIRGAGPSRMVNEVGAIDNLRLENQLTELISLVRKLAVGQHQPNMVARVCGICTSMEHPIGMCPTLQETKSDHPESVGAISATSNLEFQQNMNSSKMKFQQNMSATIQDVKMQVGQLTNIVSHLQSVGFGNLPSQIIPNLRGNASIVSLKSGRELPQATPQQKPRPIDAKFEPDDRSVPLSFLTRIISTRKLESDEELLKMFRKVEINIPLLDAIEQISKYAKFLKELCVQKEKGERRGGIGRNSIGVDQKR